MVKLRNDLKIRLEKEKIIWMATVKKNGQPHLVPVWYIVDNEHIYVWIQSKSVKAKNLHSNNKVTIALQDGNEPLIGEGEVVNMSNPRDIPPIIDKFSQKYDWSDYANSDYDLVIEITIQKWIHFNTT